MVESILKCFSNIDNQDAYWNPPQESLTYCLTSLLPSGQSIKIYSKKVLDWTSSGAKETLKVAAAVTILYAGASLFPATVTVLGVSVVSAIVLAPLAEEIFFRGILQNGIWLAQEVYNKVLRCSPVTEKDLACQKACRIGITAIAFGLLHLTNVEQSITQATWCSVLGIEYGYISEKTHTLSASILDHGLNNGLLAGNLVAPMVFAPLWLGVSFYNVRATFKGELTVGAEIMKRVESLGEYCLSFGQCCTFSADKERKLSEPEKSCTHYFIY